MPPSNKALSVWPNLHLVSSNNIYQSVGCAEIRLRFSLKKLNRPKIWHPFRQFSDRNCVQSTIQI